MNQDQRVLSDLASHHSRTRHAPLPNPHVGSLMLPPHAHALPFEMI